MRHQVERPYTLAKQGSQIITRQMIRAWRRQMPKFEQNSDFYSTYALAMMIACHCLGGDWVERNIMNSRGHGDYLRQKDLLITPPEEQDIHHYRVVEFGEGLLNLQSADGYHHYIAQLAARNDIEGAMAEMQTAKILSLFNVPFRFNKPTGVARADYDFEVMAPNQQWVCAETKCKLETTKPSPNAIGDAFRQIIKQVPSDRPSFGFLRIPETWTDERAVDIMIGKALSSLFGATTRIASIKVQYQYTIFPSSTLAARPLAVTEHDNPNTKFLAPDGWSIFRGDPNIALWKNLYEVASGGKFAANWHFKPQIIGSVRKYVAE